MKKNHTEIEKVRADLATEIGKVKADLTTEIGKNRLEIEKVKTSVEKVRADLCVEIKNSQYAMIKWMIGTVLATGLALAGMIGRGMDLF